MLWRTENGRAHVANAECPHLGADLGRGAIKDDALACPIHGLRFDAGGKCLPARPGKPAPSLHLRSYPVIEKNGIVAVWRHARNAAPDPAPPAFANFGGTDGLDLEAATAEVGFPLSAAKFEQAARRAEGMGWTLMATPIALDRSRIFVLRPAMQEPGEFKRALANLLRD